MPGVILEPLAGCIKWLPRKDKLIPADSATIDEGCCNHPVVVLSTETRSGRVEVLIITSFGGVDLETKFPTENQARRNHLPIAPGKAHPDNGILLCLQDRAHLRKRSYVNTRDKRSILLASLRPYNRRGPEIFLSKRSYKTLVKHAKFTESADAPLSGAPSRSFPSHQYDLGRSISVETSNAEEDMENLSNFLRRTADNYRANLQANTEASRSQAAAHISRITAARPERQRLLPANGDYRSYYYGSRTLLPTTHPIRSDRGDDSAKPFGWETFRKWMKTAMAICLVVAVCYGFYRGGCWVVAACGRALGWMKEAFQIRLRTFRR
ncbi:hypothetical protein F4678DRAFT_445951 [Xylaria arbuscula]|nr:hypothetical protein F4678DRAFT_445951 [Xylaria arbuscula]